MSTYPATPELEAAYRTAYRALQALIPGNVAIRREADLVDTYELVTEFEDIVRLAGYTADAELGPPIGWDGPAVTDDEGWAPRLLVTDRDNGDGHEGGLTLREGREWFYGPLAGAARAYCHEAGWDCPPGDAGLWLLMVAPVSALGGEERCLWRGSLTGFAILYDRDDDGTYESVGHLWTARAWRRRGIATRLLDEARRLGAARVEGPLTADSRALLAKAWPEQAAKLRKAWVITDQRGG